MSQCPPIALIMFNRPELTAQLLEAIAPHRPTRLFVIADGPRQDHAEDARRVAQCRELIDQLRWPGCHIDRIYSDCNLKCGPRIATGLDAVFSQVPEAIVLEDDCLPHPDFFEYCRLLLQRYRDDARIMHIGANNFQNPQCCGDYSYIYSKYNHCWGWATWARAWKMFDHSMKSWPDVRDSHWLRYICDSDEETVYWHDVFEQRYAAKVPDTWALSWTYACWIHGGLSIYPSVNLVSNRGFGPDGTHCRRADDPAGNLPVHPILPLKHPPMMVRHQDADRHTYRVLFERWAKKKSVPPRKAS